MYRCFRYTKESWSCCCPCSSVWGRQQQHLLRQALHQHRSISALYMLTWHCASHAGQVADGHFAECIIAIRLGNCTFCVLTIVQSYCCLCMNALTLLETASDHCDCAAVPTTCCVFALDCDHFRGVDSDLISVPPTFAGLSSLLSSRRM